MSRSEQFDDAAKDLRSIIEGSVSETDPGFILTKEPSGNLIIFATGAAADAIRQMIGIARTPEGMEQRIKAHRTSQPN